MSNEGKKTTLDWLQDPSVTGELKHVGRYLTEIYQRNLRTSRNALRAASDEANKETPASYHVAEKALKTAQHEMARRHVLEESLALWVGLRLLDGDLGKRIERWINGLRREALNASRSGPANAALTEAWIEIVDYPEGATTSLTAEN